MVNVDDGCIVHVKDFQEGKVIIMLLESGLAIEIRGIGKEMDKKVPNLRWEDTLQTFATDGFGTMTDCASGIVINKGVVKSVGTVT